MIPYVERLFKRSEAASIRSAQAQGFTRPLITAFCPAPLSLHLSDASHAPHQGGSGSLVSSARRAAPPRKDRMRTHKKLLLSCSPSSTLSSHSQKSERLFLKVGDYVSFLPNSSAHPFQASYDEVSAVTLSQIRVFRLCKTVSRSHEDRRGILLTALRNIP
jgi:hypothetical protein